ncbi:ferritin-like domain-containing protein [Roseospirillum parvum]|uniref:Uncharacterized conserved protein, contains ferritin-like DUF455 domain n=1 Tax=Roseospirillum parvum TaxID=83401 RepID=A0A1G7U2K0_9PROT|nr:ferritin-like domain-containing protein [Roseospirillum parvum]SDG41835.1 Uncharacterized conserved protein, contains ferritin-like DUF455 domain [Roseospirillum parvum]
MFDSLTTRARLILLETAPAAKITRTRDLATAWRAGAVPRIGSAPPPERPGRPARPQLLPPRQMPRRSGGVAGRVALLHALAHIELNAIDLAWDLIVRFAEQELPHAFFTDWIAVALDEALHFELLEERLRQLDSHYGALPAHDGLWQAAEATADDLLARLAVIPMSHEARGLDTTPATIARLTAQGDAASAGILKTILTDEIRHVRTGVRWFRFVCQLRGLDPEATFVEKLATHLPAGLKPPFNHAARAEAGFPEPWYTAAARSDHTRGVG